MVRCERAGIADAARRPREDISSRPRVFDAAQMGYQDEDGYVLDTKSPGSSNAGHDYGTNLSSDQKQELIEYLKTL